MTKNLLVLTTAGSLKWLKEALDTLRDPLDVLVVDDATPDNTIRDFCKEKGIKFSTKPKPKGLTDSWNMAYQFFGANSYENCIFSNDDVRFSEGFSRGLLKGVEKFDLIGPLSNKPGDGHSQEIEKFINIKATPENIDQMQEAITNKYSRDPFMVSTYLNGFCFAFSLSIKRFMFSDKLLFNPVNINIGNEHDLVNRINKRGGRIAVCRTSYVFHGKARTMQLPDREQLWR